MNSHQRRLCRRYWRYTADGYVIASAVHRKNSPMLWDTYREIRQWLAENMGEQGYRWNLSFDRYEFYFHKTSDYTYFLLRWA